MRKMIPLDDLDGRQGPGFEDVDESVFRKWREFNALVEGVITSGEFTQMLMIDLARYRLHLRPPPIAPERLPRLNR